MMKKLFCFLLATLMIGAVSIPTGATTIDTFDAWAVVRTGNENAYTVLSCSDTNASITVPAQLGGKPVKMIAPHTFVYNQTMQTLTVPESVTTIGDYACFGCTALREVNLPGTMTELWEGAFSGATQLSKINLQDTAVIGLEAYVFSETALTEAELPGTCTYIKDYAFRDCASLQTLTIPHTIKEIGEKAFAGCEGLTILCEEDSYAAQYAEAHGIAYRVISIIFPYQKGDADGDGKVTVMDATRIQRLLVKIPVHDPDGTAIRGDLRGDGVDIMDATAIQRYLAGMGNPHGIGTMIYR